MSGSKKDIEYFNKFEKGYYPYSENDIELLTEIISDKINLYPSPKICEIGCGSGQFSSAVSKRMISVDYQFYGVDISNAILKHYPFNRIQASAFEIPVSDGSFDVVCYPAALHHLLPLDDSLSELSRVIKKNGIMYCVEPNLYHPHRFFFMRFQNIYNKFKKVNDVPIDPEDLADKLRGVGFERVEYEFINLNFKNFSILQSLQNQFSKTIIAKKLPKYSFPWFKLFAYKK